MNLARKGGVPLRQGLLPRQETIGKEEIEAANKVLNKKLLSGFRGNSTNAFYGGDKIRELESIMKSYFQVTYAYTCNSCTSALQLACLAIGLKSGDEVIVTPYSMSCSATAPMISGAIPVFADIEYDYFCLDPASIESKITNKTKAIIVVDLFGQPYDYIAINAIAEKYGLYVIEDAAQAIGSYGHGRPAGTFGHIGCFSFTQGKHLTAGEGGAIITNDPKIERNFSLLRNHAEAVISDMDDDAITDHFMGFNMRMTEIQAAILIEQFKKLPRFVENRQKNAEYFAQELSQIPFIKPAKVRDNCKHSYYVQAFHYDEKTAGIHRDKFIEAVKAELQPEEGRLDKGVAINSGYIKPLYRMPIFRNQFNPDDYPVVEKLWKDDLFLTTLIGNDLQDQDRQDIAGAFQKVYQNMEELG